MENLLKIIEEHTAGDKSGITLVQISKRAKMPFPEVREIIGRAVSSGKIREREGINQNLYFKS